MMALLRQLGGLRTLALAALALPVVSLLVLGMLWLCYGLQQWVIRRDRALLEASLTEADPGWPADAAAPWREIEAFSTGLRHADWPLNDGGRLLDLGRQTLERVARHYHPASQTPLLEMTLPHALLIIERASRDLRQDILDHLPMSHRLRIGDVLRAERWRQGAEQVYNVYRAGRLILNPVDALISEASAGLRTRSFALARDELQTWLLRAYVRKLAYYAIELYSGRLPLDESVPATATTRASRTDLSQADRAAEQARQVAEEPLRILLLGRPNAGKSSLINALFGQALTATDVLAGTTEGLHAYRLEREGLTQALIFDSPGSEAALDTQPGLKSAVDAADLILWVSPAHRPDRAGERAALDALRARQAARSRHRPTPLLLVLSHIDLLRPASEWQPPYDLGDGATGKAASIRAALIAAAQALDIDPARAIPVCLAPGREYNIDDSLWAALLDQQDEALRVRLLRCLDSRRREENWPLLRRQLIGAGRFALGLPGKLISGRP